MLMDTISFGMSEEDRQARRNSLGGSDAKVLMSGDDQAITQLWLEKRGEAELDNLDDILLVQLGNVTEALNAHWFEKQTGLRILNRQKKAVHPDLDFIHVTLDGEAWSGDQHVGTFESKFMFPFGWKLEEAIAKYYPQLQHNMLVTQTEVAYLSVITGAAQYAWAKVEADIFYQAKLLEIERDFWDCVKTGRHPYAANVDQPVIAIDDMREVDMSTSNAWVDLAVTLTETKEAKDKYVSAEKKIKELVEKDVKLAKGRGVTITRAKNGNLSVKIDGVKKTRGKKED